MRHISFEAAAIITECSTRTLWRRVSDGEIRKIEHEGKRSMLALDDIRPLIAAPMDAEDLDYLARADAGDAEAQDDMGNLFLAAGKTAAGLYWLEQAAKQDYPNAMHRLGQCYASGEGVTKDDNLAVMWISKAATRGHLIALQQMGGILAGALK